MSMGKLRFRRPRTREIIVVRVCSEELSGDEQGKHQDDQRTPLRVGGSTKQWDQEQWDRLYEQTVLLRAYKVSRRSKQAHASC
ncbi:MAG TPA: hypothetical protein VFV38_52175 [Ktedonobacteraceae bacterium]|nr:hypothetical protein [Ktedonobacteraceae bacterium]